MLYADDAGVVSKSADGLARMMTIIVEVFREFGLTVSERKMETLGEGGAAGTATAAPDNRSSGAKACTGDRVPIVGRPRRRAGQPCPRDQPQEQSGVGVL